MRYEVTHALDAIEQRLATDPLRVGAVIDLTEAVRLPGLDSSRPANLLRVGLLVDALTRQLGDERVALYAVAERGLLADTDLTSNERMVLRRWSDDGLVEIIPAGTAALARVCEVGLALSQPVVTAAALPSFQGATMAPVAAAGAVSLVPAGTRTAPPAASALSRLWQCPEPDCPSYGGSRGESAGVSQPPPQLAAGGAAVCPRHGERLSDAGPRPYAVPMAVRVGGVARERFGLVAGYPVTVGRAPDERGGVAIADHLDDRAGRWVSRSHLRLELDPQGVRATDLSTNGSVRLVRPGPATVARREPLISGQPQTLDEWDAVELFEQVEVGRADRVVSVAAHAQPGSVMVDAPTIAMRLPLQP